MEQVSKRRCMKMKLTSLSFVSKLISQRCIFSLFIVTMLTKLLEPIGSVAQYNYFINCTALQFIMVFPNQKNRAKEFQQTELI